MPVASPGRPLFGYVLNALRHAGGGGRGRPLLAAHVAGRGDGEQGPGGHTRPSHQRQHPTHLHDLEAHYPGAAAHSARTLRRSASHCLLYEQRTYSTAGGQTALAFPPNRVDHDTGTNCRSRAGSF